MRKRYVKQVLKIVAHIFQRFLAEGCAYRAASLAYTTLLSLVPLMMIMFTILSLFPFFQGFAEKIQAIILGNFIASSADVIAKYVYNFSSHVKQLSTYNIIFLIIVGMLLIYNINRAFAAIWGVRLRFQFSLHFLFYFIFLLLFPILMGSIMLIGSFFIRIPFVLNLIKMPYIHSLLFLLPYVLVFLTFTVFNWILPSCKVHLMHAAVGGFVTTVLFEVAKYCFGWYLVYFSTYRLLYGALSVIPIFLVWLYVSWTIILLGALVSNTCAIKSTKSFG